LVKVVAFAFSIAIPSYVMSSFLFSDGYHKLDKAFKTFGGVFQRTSLVTSLLNLGVLYAYQRIKVAWDFDS
jgi:hypothetical protein